MLPVKTIHTRTNDQLVYHVETQIEIIWARLLDHQDFDHESNFFDVGGNSLLLLELQQALSKTFSKKITVIDLYKFHNIRSITKYILIDLVPSE